MQTTIDGVTITLTDEQVKQIQKTKAFRGKYLKRFEGVLIGFGFRKADSTSAEYYEHVTKGWRAKIEYGNRVWLYRYGINAIYNTPEELLEELEKQL